MILLHNLHSMTFSSLSSSEFFRELSADTRRVRNWKEIHFLLCFLAIWREVLIKKRMREKWKSVLVYQTQAHDSFFFFCLIFFALRLSLMQWHIISAMVMLIPWKLRTKICWQINILWNAPVDWKKNCFHIQNNRSIDKFIKIYGIKMTAGDTSLNFMIEINFKA